MNKTRLAKTYSALIPFFPILTIYGFQSLPFVTFSDYFLLIFVLLDVLTSKGKLIIYKRFTPLILYLLIQPIILLVYTPEDLDFVDAAGTAWKLALYVFGIVLLSKNLDKRIFVKSMRFVGVTSTVYGSFQFFLGTYAHISLSPYLPLLPVLRTGLDEQQKSWIAYNWTVRPRAWFSEPSTFAIYLLLALAIELFALNQEEKKKGMWLFYLFGIVTSTSSTGIAGLFALFFSWMLLYPSDFLYNIPKKLLLNILCALPICAIALYMGGVVTYFIDHAFANGQGLAAQSHFAFISAAFQGNNTNTWTQLFGHGMQDVATGYLPGWFGTYYCLGIVGIVLFILGFAKMFILSSKSGRIIISTFIILNFGTEIMLGVFILLYMSSAMFLQKKGIRAEI